MLCALIRLRGVARFRLTFFEVYKVCIIHTVKAFKIESALFKALFLLRNKTLVCPRTIRRYLKNARVPMS